MKYLAWFSGVLVTLVAVVYVVIFTSLGNGLLKPIVEDKIQQQTKLDSKLTTFTLNMSSFEVLLELNANNSVLIKGNYSLFSQAFDVAYRVRLDNLESLKELSDLPLQGKLYTDGKVKGDMSFMEVDGKSDVGEGDTTYHVELTDLNPTSIIAEVKNAKLSSLLYLGAQSQYASADINLDVNFKNINPGKLDGDILLITKNAKIDSQLMKKDFNVTIPNTSFAMKLDAKLKGNDVDYSYDLSSKLFSILSSGNVKPEPLQTDITYSLNIKELALLKPVIGADLRGAFKLNGTVKGSKEKLIVKGKSDLAESDTKFEAVLKDFAPKSIVASVKNLKLKKLLYMIKQPHYTDGILFLNADITNAAVGSLKGKVQTDIKNGLLNSKYITKLAGFESLMPRTTFNSTTTTILNKNLLDTKVDFNSNLVDLDIKKASYNLKDSSLKSDYLATVANLDKLFFVTQRRMKGDLSVNGELVKIKDLDLTIHTKIAGGNVDAKLHNDDFHAEFKSVSTKELLGMFIYPEIFQANLDGKLNYNLAQSKGVFSGHVIDGNFVNNNTFNLIKQYTKFDMYRESFNGDIAAEINKEKILASLDFRSKQASVKTTNAKINTKTKMIDSDVTIQAKKNTVTANIIGDINAPKVKVDLEKLMKSKAGDALKKEINKGIDKLFKKFF
ncbi:MAG: hypothetical protein OQK48_08320 [Sulfurimonas sp.]|uniref:hypothetical protein n=1 Tax=Sulfurimonas sp. TaxID=2022749 RepID=UPI002623830C|nr:hypothetical protein [Sulfurimonas sp.]MCW8895885.1 hypothetical protein [Sulfurimonas sp.]MCW8954936.1 hypothetical protein [Sulfurimonas sp.]MCW9067569.1 hypothetical protein [Sulfurimonas sp.]